MKGGQRSMRAPRSWSIVPTRCVPFAGESRIVRAGSSLYLVEAASAGQVAFHSWLEGAGGLQPLHNSLGASNAPAGNGLGEVFAFGADGRLRRGECGAWHDLGDAGGGPGPRRESLLACLTSGVVLFGGLSKGKCKQDTWLFTQGRWKDVRVKVKPPKRRKPLVAVLADEGSVVMWAGRNERGDLLTDGWIFDGSVWRAMPSTLAAPISRTGARDLVVAAILSDRSRGLSFGVAFEVRFPSAQPAAVCAWAGDRWILFEIPSLPPGDDGANGAGAVEYDERTNDLVFASGTGALARLDLTELLDEVGAVACPYVPVVQPAVRPREAVDEVYLECVDDGFKFWEGRIEGGGLLLRHGRIGTAGRPSVIEASEPRRELAGRTEEKLQRGYQLAGRRATLPAWALVPDVKVAGASTIDAIGGERVEGLERWPKCRQCNDPMCLLVTLGTHPESLPIASRGIAVFMCEGPLCEAWSFRSGANFVALLATDASCEMPGDASRARPSRLLGRVPLSSEIERRSTDGPSGPECTGGSKLGGVLRWPQDDEPVACEECGAGMVYRAQLGAPLFEYADHGVGAVFVCPADHRAALIWSGY